MRLYTKLLIGVALASVISGHGIIVYSRRTVHEALRVRMEKAVEAEAGQLAAALSAAMLTGDEGKILPILQDFVKTLRGECAAAIDLRGRIVSHTNVAEVGKIRTDPETLALLKSDRLSSVETREDDRLLLKISIPIFAPTSPDTHDDFLLASSERPRQGSRLGVLRVGLPLNETLATEGNISSRIFRVVLMLGGFAGLMLFIFMRRLLAPLALLAAATAKIRDGEYNCSIPETSNDEIGVLARSFNEMGRQLGRTTVSKNFFNDILDNIQDVVIVTDVAGLIVLVNPAVVKLLGWSRDELRGRPGAALLNGAESLFMMHSRNVSTHLRTKSGETVSVLFSSSPIMAVDGSITGYIGVAKDVSDLKKLEARMQQSEKLSAVGQLAAGVAHEINNPLGVILGFAQSMTRHLKAGDDLEMPVRSIEREALRCKALVQNLLTFARTSQSDQAVMDINAAVEQALTLIQPQAKLNQVVISLELAKGLPPVLGNKNQLEQVIMNLAKNAIDAMPNGGSLVISSELLEQASHSWIRLKFIDDGTGIPPAVASKIFDPFFTTKAVGQGTGLGLSLVSEIVQKHSGEITVESRPGRTVFTVKLPVRTGQELERLIEAGRRDKLDATIKGSISHA